MLFLLTAFALESECKITQKNTTGKKYFANSIIRITFAKYINLTSITQISRYDILQQ